MTRVLREQHVSGRRTGRRRARDDAAIDLWQEDDRSGRLKTYLLGILLVALITAGIVSLPQLSGSERTPVEPVGTEAAESPPDAHVSVPEDTPVDGQLYSNTPPDAGSGEGSAATTAGTVLASAPLRTLSEPPLVTFERTEDEEYLVEDGQTLSEIAALFGLDYYYLAEVNRLEDPDQVHAGQRIVIPPAPDNLKQTE